MNRRKKGNWFDLWKNIKLLGPVLLYVAVIITALQLLPNRNLLTTVLTVVSFALVVDFIKKVRAKEPVLFKEQFKTMWSIALIVSVFYITFNYLGHYGLAGLVLIVLLYAGYILIRRRRLYMEAVRSVETQLFGEPLIKKKEEEKIK